MDRNQKIKGVREVWDKYKFVILVVLIGVALLLLPNGNRTDARKIGRQTTAVSSTTMMRDIQGEMETVLSKISGVGTVHVLLTEESDGERQLAQNTELSYSGSTEAPEDYSRRSEIVLVDGDGEETVVTQMRYPTYRGALVVCQGGDRAEVRLAVTEAVTALTGLPSDRVTVAKCQ